MARMVARFDEEGFLGSKRIITDRDEKEAPGFFDKVLKPLVKEAERLSGLRGTFDAEGLRTRWEAQVGLTRSERSASC